MKISSEEAVKILEKLVPDISKNGFFPGKTKEQIEAMGKNAGKRILNALKKHDNN